VLEPFLDPLDRGVSGSVLYHKLLSL
jgi:hypothetical protein